MNDAPSAIARELVCVDEPKGYERVIGYLVQQLRIGALKVGDRLLPERELAQFLSVSRPLVREALRSLAMLGIVEIQRGRGTYIRSPDISALSDIFTFMFAQNTEDTDDVMEVRQGLERQAVRLACVRARTLDFEKIAAALDQIEATIGDPIAGGKADFLFHTRMVEASHSPALIKMYGVVASILERNHIARRQRILTTPTPNEFLVNHHRQIFQAIQQRDIEKSERLLTSHFEIGDQLQNEVLSQK